MVATKKLNSATIDPIFSKLREIYDSFDFKPLGCEYARQGASPYKILISTVLSLRTKDPVTFEATERLWRKATTPAEMLRLSSEEIAELIYPVGFYKRKSEQILKISQILLDQYESKVPADKKALLKLPGVGPKTANLVLGFSFKIPAICVDTHVHRICNRWGWVDTETPEETEKALEQVIPKEYWIETNDLLVAYGQNICSPVSPWCKSKCVISDWCPKLGVQRQR